MARIQTYGVGNGGDPLTAVPVPKPVFASTTPISLSKSQYNQIRSVLRQVLKWVRANWKSVTRHGASYNDVIQRIAAFESGLDRWTDYEMIKSDLFLFAKYVLPFSAEIQRIVQSGGVHGMVYGVGQLDPGTSDAIGADFGGGFDIGNPTGDLLGGIDLTGTDLGGVGGASPLPNADGTLPPAVGSWLGTIQGDTSFGDLTLGGGDTGSGSGFLTGLIGFGVGLGASLLGSVEKQASAAASKAIGGVLGTPPQQTTGASTTPTKTPASSSSMGIGILALGAVAFLAMSKKR